MKNRWMSAILLFLVLAISGVTSASGHYRAVRFKNAYSRAIVAEIRDGEATATGSGCDTNDHIDLHTFRSGETQTYECEGRDGFCWRWKEVNDDNFGSWYGTPCVGYSPRSSKSDVREQEF